MQIALILCTSFTLTLVNLHNLKCTNGVHLAQVGYNCYMQTNNTVEFVAEPAEPEAPCYYNNEEASAWQGGWSNGYEAGYKAAMEAFKQSQEGTK